MIIEEIKNVWRDIRKGTKSIEDIKKFNTKSIASRAASSTCQFPCLIDDSIPFDYSAAITKNMDRVYASFVQTVIASDPMIDISIDRGPLDYLKRMHQNIRLESAIDEDAIFAKSNEEEMLKEFAESVIPDLEVPEVLFEDTVDKVYNGEYKLFLSPDGEYGLVVSEAVLSSEYAKDNINLLKEHLSQFDLRPFPITEKTSKTDILNGMISSGSNKEKLASTKELSAPKLLDRDIKRYNELQPYGISVRLMAVNDKNEFVQYIDFIVGIKATMHIVKHAEMVETLGNAAKNSNALFNFIKWTTGEISLVKDLILGLDDMKFDVTYKSRGASPFFPSLKRMKEKKVMFSGSGITKLVPNSTIVISNYTVNDVVNSIGVDLKDTYFAKKILDELFLMAFVIVDESTQTIEILYQDASAFETYTLETLEKEVDMSSNKLGRAIGSMISK